MTQHASLLAGTCNTRTVCGCRLPLLRSDHLANADEADLRALQSLGIRTVIDLRRDDEVARNPAGAPIARSLAVFRIPIDNSSLFARRRSDPAFQLWELYAHMLRCHAREFAQCVCRIAQGLENGGGTLFHCSAGKDRTGVLAALLLRCAGVPDAQIVADYALSAEMLRAKTAEEVATIPPDTDPDFYRMLLSCEARHMEKALSLLDEMGGAQDYLLQAGVPRRLLARLSQRLRSGFSAVSAACARRSAL